MSTYLLPSERTPGDYAHLNRDGFALCGLPLHWVDESDYLCAFDLCPECDRIAKGQKSSEWAQILNRDPGGILYQMITNDWTYLKTSFRMDNPGVEVTNKKLMDVAGRVLDDMDSGQMELFNA